MKRSHGALWPNVLALAGMLFLLFGSHLPARAQDAGGIQVKVNTAVLQQQKVVFNLQASSTAVINEVTLIYGYSGHGCNAEGTKVYLPITPGTQVHARWVKDFAKDGGLLPGVELWWQFEVQNKTGEKLLTDRQTLLLMDTSRQWKVLEEDSLSLYWYEGSQAFGERLMDFASGSLQKLEKDAGVQVTGHIRVMIYPSAAEMRSALGYVSDWAGGVALGEYDLVLAGINPADNVVWAEEVLTHELTHVVTETGFVNCQAVRLPLWLVEGIAEFTEGPLPWNEELLVRAQLEAETLPRLKTLRHNFPYAEEEARLAYTQSTMVVTFMIETYGAEKLNQLIENIRTGQTIDQALRVIYGLNTDELDQTWRAGMGYGAAPEPNFITETPAPTRTPIPTLNLRPSVWKPGAWPTATATAAPPPTSTPLPTASQPATRTPIPDGKASGTPQPGLPVEQPAQDQNQWLFLAGGVLAAVGLVVGAGILVMRRMK